MLKSAMQLAKQKGAKYLRLFVVDINKPAINLYLKNGFNQVDGIYEERIDDFVLYEYGFEIEITPSIFWVDYLTDFSYFLNFRAWHLDEKNPCGLLLFLISKLVDSKIRRKHFEILLLDNGRLTEEGRCFFEKNNPHNGFYSCINFVVNVLLLPENW